MGESGYSAAVNNIGKTLPAVLPILEYKWNAPPLGKPTPKESCSVSCIIKSTYLPESWQSVPANFEGITAAEGEAIAYLVAFAVGDQWKRLERRHVASVEIKQHEGGLSQLVSVGFSMGGQVCAVNVGKFNVTSFEKDTAVELAFLVLTTHGGILVDTMRDKLFQRMPQALKGDQPRWFEPMRQEIVERYPDIARR